jgi:protoporphyrinogen oxidase
MTENDYDIVIIGSGYRAMITAYLASKKNKKILIISKSKNISGIMDPIEWEGAKFDKGYQFLDGINKHQKNLINNFVGENFLYDFGYGAASLTNNKLYAGHAIPYWPHQGNLFSLKLFIKYLFRYSIKSKKKEIDSFEDLIKLLPSEIKKIFSYECERRIGLKPNQLSHRIQDFPFFSFRQTILPDKFSYFLKKNFNYFNEIIACKRSTLGLDCISLYPKGKYIGVFAEKMKRVLLEKGVEIKDSDGVKIENQNNEKIQINTKNGDCINAKKILIVTELDDAKNFFDEMAYLDSSIYYLPSILYYFTTDKINSGFQYVQGNTVDNLINRANNMSLYGQKTSSGECVISAEVLDNKNSSLWNNPEKYVDKVWNEIKLMKLASKDQNYSKFKIFPIKKTTPMQLSNFDKNSEILLKFLKTKFNNKVSFPGLGKRTSRAFFLDDVENFIN